MPRRSFQDARKGQAYAIEWPEWHAECADQNCDETTMLAVLGEAFTIAEAEARAKNVAPDWTRFRGVWYCPKHTAIISAVLPSRASSPPST